MAGTWNLERLGRLAAVILSTACLTSCITPVQPMPMYSDQLDEIMDQELPDRCSRERLTSNFAPGMRRLTYNAYPPAALDAGIQGWVAMEYRIEADGRITRTRVLDSAPPGIFERAAEGALRQIQLPPAGAACYHRTVVTFAIAE